MSEKLSYTVKTIVERAKELGNDKVYWVLYLDDPDIPVDIDTCATAYAISILQLDKNRGNHYNSNGDYIYDEQIRRALNVIIKLRRKEGCWPSLVNAESFHDDETRDVAIGDNYFALTALLDVGFLSVDFFYNDILPNNLKELKDRVDYVMETVKWLKNNKSDEYGWYYTNYQCKENNSRTLPTTNVVIVLSRIRDDLIREGFIEQSKEVSGVIDGVLQDLSFSSNNGIGVEVNSNSNEKDLSLFSTCKLIDAFIYYGNKKYSDEILECLDFICNNYNEEMRNKHIAEPYRIRQGGFYLRIKHENFIEGILLFTLLNVIKAIRNNFLSVEKKKEEEIIFKLEKIIESEMSFLKGLRSNGVTGLFKCHVDRENECWFPMYSTFEGFRVFCMYQDYLDFYSSPSISNIKNDFNIEDVDNIIHKLIDFYREKPTIAYEESRNICLESIKKLEDIKTKIKSDGFSEQIKIDYNKIVETLTEEGII